MAFHYQFREFDQTSGSWLNSKLSRESVANHILLLTSYFLTYKLSNCIANLIEGKDISNKLGASLATKCRWNKIYSYMNPLDNDLRKVLGKSRVIWGRRKQSREDISPQVQTSKQIPKTKTPEEPCLMLFLSVYCLREVVKLQQWCHWLILGTSVDCILTQ